MISSRSSSTNVVGRTSRVMSLCLSLNWVMTVKEGLKRSFVREVRVAYRFA